MKYARPTLKRILVLLLTLTIAPFTSYAQSTFARITGFAKDTSGAFVPNAQLTLTEVQTRLAYKTTTGSSGYYEFANIPAGRYVVMGKAEGFADFQTAEFPVVAREEQRVDVNFAVASQTAKVEVVATPPIINTENSSVSDATSNRDLVNAPINYRTFNTSPLQALYVLPEVVGSVSTPDGRTATDFNIQGSSWNWTDTSVDGIYVGSARRNGTNLDTFPSTEIVSELRVNAIGNNAEFAQVSDISFITKSGGNNFHGSLFYNYNGNALNANPNVVYNQPHLGIETRSVNNNSGGSISGPILRNRTFFFGDYENLQIHQYAAQDALVFPEAFRNGDFSSLLSGSNPIQLIDPFTGTPYTNNKITEAVNPVTKVLLDKYFPAPNSGSDHYQFSSPATTTSNQYDARIDHTISDRQRIFGRWTQKLLTPVTPVEFPALGNNTVQNHTYDTVFSYNFVLTPSKLNEFRFGWSQSNQDVKPISVDHTQALSDLGLNLIATSFPAGVGFPHIFVDGFDAIDFQREEDLKERNAEFADNFTWIHNRHTMKFGGSDLLLKVNEQSTFNGADGLGEFYFKNFLPSAQNASLNGGTGYSVANFYLGLPSNIDQDSAGPDWEGVAHQYGFFGQDTWQASPRLTLSYGLRWEYNPPFHENHGNVTNFDPTNGDAIVPNTASLALASPTFVQSLNGAKLLTASQVGIPENLRFSDKTDFNPRVGFAFLPFGNSTSTVIRGGYGIYTIRVLGAVFNSLTGIHTASALNFFPVVNTATHTPSIVWPDTTDSSANVGASPLQSFSTAVDLHFRDPYTQQWSITLEHQLSKSAAVRATYSGQHAILLAYNPNLNQIPFNTTGQGASGAPANRPYAAWDYLSSRENGGFNKYNDLTLQFKVSSRALTLTSTYIFANAISDDEGATGSNNFTSEIGSKPSDRFHLNLDRGHQLGIPSQHWVTSFDYTSPFGKGGSLFDETPRIVHAVAGEWNLFTIMTLESGHHLTPYSAWNISGIENPASTRTDLVAGKNPNSGPHSVAQWFNTSALSTDAFHTGSSTNFLGRVGTSPVGSVIGPDFFELDTALRRDFPVGERFRMAILAQAKNVLNHPNLSDPNLNADDSTNYGKVFNLRPNSTRTLIVGGRLEF